MLSFLLGVIFPQLSTRIPTNRLKALNALGRSTRGIATELLDNAAKEEANVGVGGEVDRSILGTLGEIFVSC